MFIVLALAVVLGVPFALRPAPEAGAGDDAPALVIITPHVQQIRREFGAAFERWHLENFGGPARVDWRTPGGTSEILRQLEAQYAAAIKAGRYRLAGDPAAPGVVMPPGTIGFDLLFGGGSYDHGRLKAGIPVWLPLSENGGVPRELRVPMSVPAGFPPAKLDEWFGENRIGAQILYDPQQHWLGVALSGFGIVYNRDTLRKLGLPEPRAFGDLADPRYAGWVALADPRQSGSVATSFDSILSNAGWDLGWRTLREMCANTRYFTNSSTKPPIDVSAGEAAAGLAIDFYGRGQSQSVMLPGQTPESSRVGYVDPAGSVYVDADPVSILRGGPRPELARRFVEFCLSEEGQALMVLHATGGPKGAGNPVGAGGRRLGPERYELRRAPARRVMYQKYSAHMVDPVNAFEIASPTTPRGWRSAIGVMMGAFSIDIADEQRAAWAALNRARNDPGFDTERLAEMERLFYAWPETRMPDGTTLPFTPGTCRAIMASWKQPGVMPAARIGYTEFFRECYRRILELAAGR